ncbi:hypothetical protein C8N46_102315 [Kordia periserrulae]|uniref:Uncharacterized protein n=1 Tax=Kordia periserrulae TaxID=701523 RepID=A0A2T6C3N3_9FLAO|nr:hypothetical protein [Kordia periserrulae]PTX62914.1 hypothetical protein C8N46_102315 [Kordia periserrulae]
MSKPLLLSLFICVLIISCTKTVTETVTNTVIKKEIVYLQKRDDTLMRVKLPKKNGDLYQFKILKNDTIFRAEKDSTRYKPSFERFDSIHNVKATFENKHINVERHDEYIQVAETKNIVSKNTAGLAFKYVLKRLTQRYQDYKVSGLAGTKHNLQFFRPENLKNPAYELNFYTDALRIYEKEGYLLTTIFGCCTSLPIYQIFDFKGKFIFNSNNLIKRINTEYGHYLISVLKNEVYDHITVVIQDKHQSKQYITLSDEIHNYEFGANYQLKINDRKKIEKVDYDKPLETYNLKSLDDLEIWIPFGKADTLKIPFKNEKAFGVDYPQVKVTLQKHKKPAN